MVAMRGVRTSLEMPLSDWQKRWIQTTSPQELLPICQMLMLIRSKVDRWRSVPNVRLHGPRSRGMTQSLFYYAATLLPSYYEYVQGMIWVAKCNEAVAELWQKDVQRVCYMILEIGNFMIPKDCSRFTESSRGLSSIYDKYQKDVDLLPDSVEGSNEMDVKRIAEHVLTNFTGIQKYSDQCKLRLMSLLATQESKDSSVLTGHQEQGLRFHHHQLGQCLEILTQHGISKICNCENWLF